MKLNAETRAHIARLRIEICALHAERAKTSAEGRFVDMSSPAPLPGRAKHLDEVWFLTGSQGLYGPEVVTQVEDQSRQIAEILDAAKGIGFTVVWKPVLTSADAIRHTVLAANSDDNCIGLVAWMHTFSPGKMWIARMDALRKPLLHLHTQADESLPLAEIDMDFMNLNHATHGDREFGYIRSRLGVSRKTVADYASHPGVLAAVGAWGRAARGAATARTMKLARFGDNMRDVAVAEGDKVEAQRRFGVSVNTYGVNDLVAVVDQVSDAAVDALAAEYDEQYTVVPSLRPGGADRESLRYAAKIPAGTPSNSGSTARTPAAGSCPPRAPSRPTANRLARGSGSTPASRATR